MFTSAQTSSLAAGYSGRGHPLQKTILFATPQGGVPHRLKQAIENELRWAVVEEVHRVREACTRFSDTVSIILVDAAFLPDVEACANDLRRHHPLAPVMLLLDRNGPSHDFLPSALESPIVRGILPLNSPTDLMISVISVMLRGGEYFPRQWFKQPAPPARKNSAAFAKGVPENDNGLCSLTRRELEVLDMVARGLQNKAIAATLHLSEHTIKIHIHNIISKLGAHNRTQASSMYWDHRDTLAVSACGK